MTDIDADLLELADGPDRQDKVYYPLEGKYIDEEDRERILGLSELEREAILGERAEQQAEQQQRQHLRRLVHERESRHTGPSTQQSERSKKLDELRRRRENKAAPKRKYSYEDEDEEEEDVYEDEEEDEMDDEKDESYDVDYDVPRKSKKTPVDTASKEPAGPGDLKRICVTRKQIVQILRAPWLKEWIIGTWVRYLVGVTDGQRAYRLCQVINLEPSKHAYRVEGVKVQFNVVLKHGKSERAFPMENISNTPFETREFARLAQTLQAEGLALPTRGAVEKKAEYLETHSEYLLTEADVASLIASRRKESIVERKSRLILAREQAATQRDTEAWTRANDELRALLGAGDASVVNPDNAPVGSASTSASSKPQDVVARINERNRLLNAGAGRRKAPRLDPTPAPSLPPLDLSNVPVLDQGLLRKALLADNAGLFEYHAAQNVGLSLPVDF